MNKMNEKSRQDLNGIETNEASTELKCMLRDLFRSLKDPVCSVREAVQVALIQLGLKRPKIVISYCQSVLKETLKKQKNSGPLCTIVLDVLSAILAELSQAPDDHQLTELIKTVCKFVEQQSTPVGKHANKVLVQLSGFHCTEVMEHLLTIMAETKRPLVNVIEVSGQLASHHTTNIRQLLPVLLTQTMHYLTQATDDSIRVALIVTLGQYCDSVLEYLSTSQDALATWETIIELLSPHTCAAVEIILNWWLPNAKEMMLVTAIYENFGSIASLTESNYLISHLSKLLNCLITQWRRAASPALELALCQSLNTFVSTVIKRLPTTDRRSVPGSPNQPLTQIRHGENSLLARLSASPKLPAPSTPVDLRSLFESELDGLIACLFQHLFQLAQRQVSVENPTTISTYTKVINEIKRAFATICSFDPKRVWMAVQPNLSTGSELSRTITLELLRYLISTESSPDRSSFSMETRNQIVSSMLRLLFGTGVSLPGHQHQQQQQQNTMNTPAVASAVTANATSTSSRRNLRQSLMGDVVHGAPVGRNRDSLLLGDIASGDHLPSSIRFSLIKLVLTMGSLGYLDLEGGHILIEFIVHQCASAFTAPVSHDKTSRTVPSQLDIHNLCVHVMKLSSTTVSAMRSVLWPFLLEFLLPVDFTDAVGVVCDSIANLLTKSHVKDENRRRSSSAMYASIGDCLTRNDAVTESSQSAETPLVGHKILPSPHKLFARLVVLLGFPMHGGNRGLPILRVMLAMAKQIHPTIPVLWDLVLPRMMRYLDQDQLFHESDDRDSHVNTADYAPFNPKHWEELTLKMLLKSIEQIADEEWTMTLINEFQQQATLYEKLPDERGFLNRCLAVAVSKVSSQQCVTEAAEMIIQSTNHDSTVEQESCAEALGVLSAVHTELILDLLTRQIGTLDSYSPSNAFYRLTTNRANSGSNLIGMNGAAATPNRPASSVQRRLNLIFRSHSTGSGLKLESTCTRPLPAYFRGSVDTARATVIRSFTQSLRRMPVSAALPHVDMILKGIVGPMIANRDLSPCILLAVIELIGQIGHVVQSSATSHAEADLEVTVPTPLELLRCLLEILNLGLEYQSVSIPLITSTGSHSGILVVLDPIESIAAHPFPSESSRVIRHMVLKTAANLLTTGVIHTLHLSSLLITTAAVVLSEPTDDTISTVDAHSVTARETNASGQDTEDLELDVERLWLRIIQLGCSDELISNMIKVLVPYLSDPAVNVRSRALRLFNAVLTGTLEQLRTVSNEAMYALLRTATGLSLSGQLLGYLVTRLGDASSTRSGTIRKQAKLVLMQLLRIFRLLSADSDGSSPADLDIPETGDSTSSKGEILGTDRLLGELALYTPRAQIPDLLELIWLSLSRRSGTVTAGDSHPDALESSADESVSEAPALPNWSSGRIGSQHSHFIHRSSLVSCHTESGIPRSEAGYLTRLLIALLRHRSAQFEEKQLETILHSAYALYSKLSIPGLRAGVLLALAELGKHWPVLCLQTIASSPLPLDLTWSAFLGAMAFLPVIPATPHSPISSKPNDPLSSDASRTSSLSRLLSHVLHVLECCLPYERREIPVDSWQSTHKRGPIPLPNPDGPVSQEVRFGTHAWLSFINCLQILSYPVDLDQLIQCHGTDQTSLRICLNQSIMSSKQPEPTKRRLFSRAIGPVTPINASSAQTLPRDAPRPSVIGLTACISEPSVCCRVLGHWLLAHATAAGCRTPIGKSYENRSGAEANLKYGVRPITISAEGLHGFLETCGLHPLLQTLITDSSKSVPSNPAPTQKVTPPHKASVEANGKLFDPDMFLDVVEVIARYVIENLPSTYLVGFVNFFLAYLNSAYEPYRMVATKWLASVLSHGPQQSASFFTKPPSMELSSGTSSAAGGSVTPDYLFGQLLKRLEDSSSTVRRVAIIGLGDIGSSVAAVPHVESRDAESENLDGNASIHPTARLIRRHSAAVTRGLFLVLNENEESDTCLLLDALHSLGCILPYTSGRQLGPLIGDLCQRLWPIYTSSTDAIRAAAFDLFGTLTRFASDDPVADAGLRANPSSHSTLISEARSVLIPVLLHLADPSPNVVDGCKTTLKKMAPLLFGSPNHKKDRSGHTTNGIVEPSDTVESASTAESATGVKGKSAESGGSKRLLEFFNNCLRPDLKLHQGEFFNELARLLVTFWPDQVADYTMRCTVFYNSDWPEIQCSAVLFSGFLMGHFTDEIRNAFPRNQVCEELLQLLRSNNPDVRATTAHTLSRLYQF